MKSYEKKLTKKLEQNKKQLKGIQRHKTTTTTIKPSKNDPKQQFRLNPSTSAAHILSKSQNKGEPFPLNTFPEHDSAVFPD